MDNRNSDDILKFKPAIKCISMMHMISSALTPELNIKYTGINIMNQHVWNVKVYGIEKMQAMSSASK